MASLDTKDVKTAPFSDYDHGKHLLERLQVQRSNSLFCDVTVRVESRDFHAHRNILAANSPYFEAMFCSGLRESYQDIVTVSCTSASAMGQILDYMYSGTMNITADNVEDVILGADHLLMSELKARCADYLRDNLDHSNCVGFREIANRYYLEELQDAANVIIRRDFENVVMSEEVLNLSVEGLLSLVSDPEIILPNESCIFELVIKWVKYNLLWRQNYLPRLMSAVRLFQLDMKYIKESIESESIVAQSPYCREIIAKCLPYLYMYTVRRETSLSKSLHDPQFHPRPGTLFDVVVVTSENPAATLGYVIGEDRWVELASLPGVIRSHSSAVLNGRLYVVGGENRDVSSDVHCYDPLTNSWTRLREMLSPAWGHCAVACNGLLYIFSMRIAHDGAMLQAYDPEKDEWQYVAPMRLHIHPSLAQSHDNNYVYLVGGDGGQTKRYDTVDKSWSTLAPLPSATSPLWALTWIPVDGVEACVTNFHSVFAKFNTSRNGWQDMDELPTRVPSKASCVASCVVGKDVYVFGGCTEPLCEQGRCECFVFNVASRRWKTLKPAPKPLLNLKQQPVRCGLLKVPYKFL